jgi:hypothetical protein
MRKSAILGLLILLSALVLITYVRKTEFKQRVGTESLGIEKNTLDRKATPSEPKTRALPDESNLEPRRIPCEEFGQEHYEARAQKDPADTAAADQSADARFKEHLSFLFGLSRPAGPQDGTSATNSALPTHTQDTECGQNTGLFSSNEERTATSLAKTSKHSDPEDRGAYAERGFAYISKQGTKKKEYYESLPTEDSTHTSAMNARVGYRFNERLALEIDFDYIPRVSGYELAIDSDALTPADQSGLDVITYMPAVKFSPDLGSKTARPYIIGGFGLMHADTAPEQYNPAMWFVDPNRESELEASGKIGLGLELRKDNTSLGIQGSFASGFGDLADLVYQTWSMGLTLHW